MRARVPALPAKEALKYTQPQFFVGSKVCTMLAPKQIFWSQQRDGLAIAGLSTVSQPSQALGGPGWGLMMARHEISAFHCVYIYISDIQTISSWELWIETKLAVMIGFRCQDSIA